MSNTKHETSNNYAVAKVFNEQIMAIIILVVLADVSELPEEFEIKELNRTYILLTSELEQLYRRTPDLLVIKPEPIWRHFEVLKTSTWEIINEYLEDPDNDVGQAHAARVEKLCILSGVEIPVLTSKQTTLLDDAKLLISKYGKMIDRFNEESKVRQNNNWQIPEYKLSYQLDGAIVVNDVLILKKAHAGSATERLLEQSIKNPNMLFKPNIGQTSRNISTVLSSAGFSEELRKLFFPTVSSSKGIVFRPFISRKQADSEKINTSNLDSELKDLGAQIEPKT